MYEKTNVRTTDLLSELTSHSENPKFYYSYIKVELDKVAQLLGCEKVESIVNGDGSNLVTTLLDGYTSQVIQLAK